MKIIELEERINKRINEEGLNKPENALDNSKFKQAIDKCICKELVEVGKELSNCYIYPTLHDGNRYYGEHVNSFYTYIEVMLRDVHYIGHSFKIEFALNKKRGEPRYKTLWYTNGIKVNIQCVSDKNTEIQDLIDKEVKEIKELEKEQKERERKEKEEAEKAAIEHQKFVEEKTKELLEYINVNNLDLQEFKDKARDYMLYVSPNI